ncbi:MAG TPA: amidohydrolase [Patescibacteria group bacterium]|nr:amidohydrolase [Patescibacteria group bacterium]
MIALTGAQIHTMTGAVIEQGTVLVRAGKIAAVGTGIEVPADYRTLDVSGKVITPGLIDAHTHLGVYSEALAWAGEDGNESSGPVTPGMDVLDALYPDDVGLSDAAAGGITTVMVAPGSANPVGGQCVIIKTRQRATVEEMILRRHAGLKIAFGENPRRVYGQREKAPVTRMAVANLIRQTLVKGKEYLLADGKEDRKYDLDMEAVARVLKREMPLRAHAHRADDIVTALRIAREFDVDIIIEHATEGHRIAGWLARENARLVLGPNLTTRSKMELKSRSIAGAAVLAEHGVTFALMSDHPVLPSALLPVYAGLASRYGLSADRALRAITADAADISGVADRVGSLAAGKDADLVVWDDHPLLLAAKPRLVMIDGVLSQVDEEQTLGGWEG